MKACVRGWDVGRCSASYLVYGLFASCGGDLGVQCSFSKSLSHSMYLYIYAIDLMKAPTLCLKTHPPFIRSESSLSHGVALS